MTSLSEYQIAGLKQEAQAKLRMLEGEWATMTPAQRKRVDVLDYATRKNMLQLVMTRIAKYYTNLVNVNYKVNLTARHKETKLEKEFKAIGLRKIASLDEVKLMTDDDHYQFLEHELTKLSSSSAAHDHQTAGGVSAFAQVVLGLHPNYEPVPVMVRGKTNVPVNVRGLTKTVVRTMEVERYFTFTTTITPMAETKDPAPYSFDTAKVRDILRQIRVDAVSAPEIGGYKSVESGPFGCMVNFISSLKKSITPKEIFNRFAEKYAFTHNLDKFLAEPCKPGLENGELDFIQTLPILPGFVVKDLERYIQTYDNENVYHINFLNGQKMTLNQEKFKGLNHERSAINILVNNNHVYIRNDETKILKHNTIFDEVICAPGDVVDDLYENLFNSKKNSLVDFAEDHHARDFISYCYYKKNFLPMIKQRETNISEIVVNDHSILVSKHVNLRKNFIADLKLEFPNEASFKSFKNQSWIQIACSLADQAIRIGDYSSYDSITDRELLNTFKTTHVIGLYEPCDGSRLSVDLNKCYLNIMLESGDRSIGSFAATDNFIPYINEINAINASYEYIIDRFTKFNIPVKSQVWNGHTVLKLLELGAIDISMIKQYRSPSKVLKLSGIVNMLKSWQQKYPTVLKYLYTQWLGYCGISEDKKHTSYLTTDADEYHSRHRSTTGCEIPCTEITPNQKPPLFLLSATKRKQKLHNLNPINRYVVGEGITRLLDLSRLMLNHGYKTIATRVDCCYLINAIDGNATRPENLVEVVKSIAKVQNKNVGLTVQQRPFDTYSTIMNRINDVTAVKVDGNGIVIDGPAGSGKTTEAIRIANTKPAHSVVCLAVMRKVVANLKSNIPNQKYVNFAKMERFQQWTTNFSNNRPAPSKAYEGIVKSAKTIIVDEYSMMGAREYNILHRLCYDFYCMHDEYPEVMMVGDNLQINPVKQATIECKELINRKAFPFLTQWIDKPYIKESGRYNYYPTVKEFLETKKLPQAFLDRVFSPDAVDKMPLAINIAAHNAIRYDVIRMKQSFMPDDKIIIIKSSNFNLKTSKNASYDNGEIMLRQEAIDRKIPESDYESAFCFTSHKSQGSTFEENYGIYELDKMSLQQAYVSLTRGRRLEQIVIAGRDPAIHRLG